MKLFLLKAPINALDSKTTCLNKITVLIFYYFSLECNTDIYKQFIF